jgi:hypothetical protein
MTGPYDPQYPGPEYGQYPPYGAPGQPTQTATYRPPFEGRLALRPGPRAGVSVAGVGAAVLMFGAIVWAYSYILEGLRESLTSGRTSDSRHYIAAVVFLVLVAIGYGIAIVRQRGPLVSAAVTVTAIGVPITMALFTGDPANGSAGNGDAVYWVSIVAYLLSYFFVRGTRGHTVYLGLSAVQLWGYVLVKAEPHLGQALANRLLGGVQSIPGLVLPPSQVNFNTVGGISLAFGIGYLLLAWWLDRTGRHGPATPLALVGLLVVLAGIAAFSPDIEQIGSGLLLIVVGALVAIYGGGHERRFTTWTGALAAGFGAVLVLAKILEDTSSPVSGIWLTVLGVLLVAGGALLRVALREPDDMSRAVAQPTPDGPMR